MDYHRFKVEDFASDEFFQAWVLLPDTETDRFWQGWVIRHPEKSEVIESARRLILNIEFQTQEPDESRKEEIWKSIVEANEVFDSSLRKIPVQLPKVRTVGFFPWLYWRHVAAVVALLFMVGLETFLMETPSRHSIEEATSFGETRTIVLPDSSVVVLNGNSTISYLSRWAANEPRELWLQGEAYFSVVRTGGDQKFVVYTSENINIEVLGTTFNVLQRPDRTRVVLNSGSIKLNLYGQQSHEEVLMKPGELLELKQDQPSGYVKKNANPEHFSSWTANKLTFDGTRLSELVSILKENYGLEVTLSDSTLLDQKLWGSVPSNDVTLLLEAISNSFDFRIEKTGDRVWISKRKTELAN